jgi:hypothetical protein
MKIVTGRSKYVMERRCSSLLQFINLSKTSTTLCKPNRTLNARMRITQLLA